MTDEAPGAEEPVEEPVEPDIVDEGEVDTDLGGLDLATLLGGAGGEAGGGLAGILEMAQQLQAGMVEAQAEAAATVVEGVAGGGAVRIEATAGLEFRAVHIRPDAVDPNDVELLEDLVLAALRDAVVRANEVQASALGGLGGLGGLLPDEG
jgi:DNA-binding YbaB/EbfC family protein